MYLKRLRNGLLVVSGAFVMWRIAKIVALTTYTKVGPFINSSSPGIDQNFLNGLENYVFRVPIASKFGPYTVNETPTFFNHNLVDQNGTAITPDSVLLQITGTSISTFTVEYDAATITSTQVKLTSNNVGGITVRGIALKF